MKPPSIPELERVRDRGMEPQFPIAAGARYLVGGEWVAIGDLVRRLVRRCLELEGFVQGEMPKPEPQRTWGVWLCDLQRFQRSRGSGPAEYDEASANEIARVLTDNCQPAEARELP